jgi:hypothetical protein
VRKINSNLSLVQGQLGIQLSEDVILAAEKHVSLTSLNQIQTKKKNGKLAKI